MPTEMVHDIRWLENPLKYDYLRKSYYQCLSRRYFKKGKRLRGVSLDFYKLVGFRFMGESGGIYQYEIYWLKEHDRGCPNEHPNYSKGGKWMPDEACLVKAILRPLGVPHS